MSGQLNVALPAAFEMIRDYARRHQITVRVVARAILHGDLPAADLEAG